MARTIGRDDRNTFLSRYCKDIGDLISTKLDKTRSNLAEGAEYASSRGDIMLELSLSLKSTNECVLSLLKRENATYRHEDGRTVDITSHSGIHIPETDQIAVLQTSGLERVLESSERVSFNNEFSVRRDELIAALHNLTGKITEYESKRIIYEQAYYGKGIDRNALVCVTKMGLLRQFQTAETKRLPNTYHTSDKKTRIVTISESSNGCKIYIPPKGYFNKR
ncbi:MAG: hypothetical protein V1729_02250 [Candidatus Woesearchaeota archaeon]